MRDLSGTGQVYRFTLSQLLKSRANRVTLIIMVLLAAVSMPLTALLGGETPETSDTAGLASVRVDNRTDLALDFSGDAYWADTDFSADAGEPDAVVTVTGDETGYQVAVNGRDGPAGRPGRLPSGGGPVVPAAGGPDGIHRGGGLP